jgi:hypothetical protein
LAQKQSWVGLIPVILRPIKVGIEAVMSWQNECFPIGARIQCDNISVVEMVGFLREKCLKIYVICTW